MFIRFYNCNSFEQFLCCVDWEKKTLIGDLKKESLLEIWNGKKLRDIQLLHIQKQRKKLKYVKIALILRQR